MTFYLDNYICIDRTFIEHIFFPFLDRRRYAHILNIQNTPVLSTTKLEFAICRRYSVSSSKPSPYHQTKTNMFSYRFSGSTRKITSTTPNLNRYQNKHNRTCLKGYLSNSAGNITVFKETFGRSVRGNQWQSSIVYLGLWRMFGLSLVQDGYSSCKKN